jgi:predicted phosphodiesterase
MKWDLYHLRTAIQMLNKHTSVKAACRELSFKFATNVDPTNLRNLFRRRKLKDPVQYLHNSASALVAPAPPPEPPPAKAPKAPARASRSKDRVIIPDFHGQHIDPRARAAFLAELRLIDPEEVVFLGDGLDCGGTFSTHQRSYNVELAESYDADCRAANSFIDDVMRAAPRAVWHYLEGNHEQHVERWASRTFNSKRDADKVLEAIGPEKVLRLKERGIKYYRMAEHYMGLSIPGTIKLGKCFFTHGISHGKGAAAVHLHRFNACVVFGHTHTPQSLHGRTVTSENQAAWCPGTLAKLQPRYFHSLPTNWAQGYGYQHVLPSGVFLHMNVPIVLGTSAVGGQSLLVSALDSLTKGRKA